MWEKVILWYNQHPPSFNAVNIHTWTVPEKCGKINTRGTFLVTKQSKGLKCIYFFSYSGVKKDFYSALTESVKSFLLCSLYE